jgi:hypothetical protein
VGGAPSRTSSRRIPAVVTQEPLFDPGMARLRA